MILKVERTTVRRSLHRMVRCLGPTHRRLIPPLWILWQVVCDRIPRGAAFYESVKLRPNPGVIIERPHANRDLRAVRPITAEQTRTALDTEGFNCAFTLSVDFDQLLTLQQPELLS